MRDPRDTETTRVARVARVALLARGGGPLRAGGGTGAVARPSPSVPADDAVGRLGLWLRGVTPLGMEGSSFTDLRTDLGADGGRIRERLRPADLHGAGEGVRSSLNVRDRQQRDQADDGRHDSQPQGVNALRRGGPEGRRLRHQGATAVSGGCCSGQSNTAAMVWGHHAARATASRRSIHVGNGNQQPLELAHQQLAIYFGY